MLSALATTRAASAGEPWSDEDPAEPPTRTAFGEYGFRGGAEYRAQYLYINPIDPSSPTYKRINWIEQRLRLDATVDWQDKVKLVLSSDVLDGTLWGDNGTFGTDPEPNSGLHINAKNPNTAVPCVTLRGTDPLDKSSYGYGLCSQSEVTIRRAYGEVLTPIGVLRIGRQPVNIGSGVQNSDGDGRPNRFGISRTGNFVDRAMFATKPLEAFKPEADRDKSATNGFFLILGYDQIVTGDPTLFADDIPQTFEAFRFLSPTNSLGRDTVITGYHAFRWDQTYDSRVHSFGLKATHRFGDLYAGFDFVTNQGWTREVSTSYSLITNDPAFLQSIHQEGLRAVVRYDQPLWTAYMEFDWASGDSDPQSNTPLTQFTFAQDTNVGLLLFKHVLAYQTARSAAAAEELLKRLGATTFPAQAVATNGAFTNGIAAFPQFDVHPIPTILLRGGALFAWSSSIINDPIQSLRRKDSADIGPALVNFAGGKPARYYGTELDGRAQWRYLEHFLFDLEGAILFPGDGLKNQDGQAVRSVMVEGRTTFVF
jgi:hypothetical protein